jgi:hypothetical protein
LSLICLEKEKIINKQFNLNIQKNKIRFAVLLISALCLGLSVIPGTNAQDSTDISVSLGVEEGQSAEINVLGCWEYIDVRGTMTWTWNQGEDPANVGLFQPGDRDNDVGIKDRHGWYEVEGGAPNGNANITDTNAFAYADCAFDITVHNYANYQIQYYGTDFESLYSTFPDMAGSHTAGFDYILESEDPDDPTNADKYPAVTGQGEHGFFIVGLEGGTGTDTLDSGDIALDTGYGGTTYSTQKAFNATDCNTSRPCYHEITPGPGEYAKILVEDAGYLTNAQIEIRTGLGASGQAAGDYTMTQTMAFVPVP